LSPLLRNLIPQRSVMLLLVVVVVLVVVWPSWQCCVWGRGGCCCCCCGAADVGGVEVCMGALVKGSTARGAEEGGP
jgi:hypothetical protein